MRAAARFRVIRFAPSMLFLFALVLPATLSQPAHGETVTGTIGAPVDPVQHGSPGISAVISIVPTGPTELSNCIPFGDNVSFGFTGFMYRNVPAFSVAPGSQISFDLGDLNDIALRRNIYFSVANMNPGPPVISGGNLVPQGVQALGWTQVVSEAQVPLNSMGNTIAGDYELTYTVEAPFNFPGGGLIVGFAGSPPATYPDSNCEQVLVNCPADDPSGLFYGRFFFRDHLYLGVLDDLPAGGGNAIAIGGLVIREEVTSARSGTWGTLKIQYR